MTIGPTITLDCSGNCVTDFLKCYGNVIFYIGVSVPGPYAACLKGGLHSYWAGRGGGGGDYTFDCVLRQQLCCAKLT